MKNFMVKLLIIILVEILLGYLNFMGYIDELEVNGFGCCVVVWV